VVHAASIEEPWGGFDGGRRRRDRGNQRANQLPAINLLLARTA
jgi:hypothetical protein